MDTRTKILTAAAAWEAGRRLRAQGKRLTAVTGHFDPLLPAHARRLAALAGGDRALIVVLTDPPRPILSVQARAELVAALAVVDYVVPAGAAELRAVLGGLEADEVVCEEAADLARARELMRHVQGRQGNR